MKVLHAKILFHLVIFLPTLLCIHFIQFCFVNCTNYVNGRKKAFVRRSITATKHHVLYVLFSVHMRHELIKFVLCCNKNTLWDITKTTDVVATQYIKVRSFVAVLSTAVVTGYSGECMLSVR